LNPGPIAGPGFAEIEMRRYLPKARPHKFTFRIPRLRTHRSDFQTIWMSWSNAYSGWKSFTMCAGYIWTNDSDGSFYEYKIQHDPEYTRELTFFLDSKMYNKGETLRRLVNHAYMRSLETEKEWENDRENGAE
jgi:hypothetical protein